MINQSSIGPLEYFRCGDNLMTMMTMVTVAEAEDNIWNLGVVDPNIGHFKNASSDGQDLRPRFALKMRPFHLGLKETGGGERKGSLLGRLLRRRAWSRAECPCEQGDEGRGGPGAGIQQRVPGYHSIMGYRLQSMARFFFIFSSFSVYFLTHFFCHELIHAH